MTLLLILIVVGAVIYFMTRSRRQTEYPPDYGHGGFLGGAGSLMTGAILGYLLSNYLISQQQYDDWQNMNAEELQQTLTNQGIMSEDDFSALQDRAAAGELDRYAAAPEAADQPEDYYADNNDYDDFDDSGFGDGGGFDV